MRGWAGKQGTLEVEYDYNGKWYAHQPVETQAFSQPLGQGHAFVDLGVKYPITAGIEGHKKAIAYDGAPLLTDWWYWNRRIAEAQSELMQCNKKHTSKRLKKLYRTRQRRFRQAVNTYCKNFIERCHNAGVSEIVAGDLTNIRNNGSKGVKVNAMLNNFWSHRYLAERLHYTAENYGIARTLIDERGTSSKCPRCSSTEVIKRGRLVKCKVCGLETHRDAAGMYNIGLVHGFSCEGGINWGMTAPEVVSPLHINLEGTPNF